MASNPADRPPSTAAPAPPGNEPPLRNRSRTFVAVLLTEALVVGALWAFGWYFTP